MRTTSLLAIVALSAVMPAQDPPGQGQLLGPGNEPFPLEHTDVKAAVTGPVARVVVRQTFTNPFQEPIEAVYVFPLPDESAVDGFTMEIGSRRIRGEIHKRKKAEEIYEEAKKKGQTTALLTQERPNVFTQRVANVLPGERIVVEIRYVEDLPYEKGAHTLVFPMVVGPRYHPPGAVPDEDKVPGRPDEYLADGERPGNEVALRATIDAGVPVDAVTSPSHRIEVERGADDGVTVSLASTDRIPNKDFTLKWRVAGETVRAALLAHRTDGDGHFMLMVHPEASPTDRLVMAREVFLVVDCSGSMKGQPIGVAKKVVRATLGALRSDDTFQVLRFSEKASALSPRPLPATPGNLARAREYVGAMSGGGGTRMIEGIRAALSGGRDSGRIRVVHFLTDGFIGNEQQILGEVKRLLEGARIFPLGVGSSPNRFLLDRLARVGRGSTSYVRHDASAERVEREVALFVERVRQPTIVDVELDWGGLPVKQVLPMRTPDLFVGKPLVLHGVYTHPGRGTLRIKGWRAGVPWQQDLEVVLPEREEDHAALPKLWARARIRDLALEQAGGESKEIEQEITDLALRHGLMSPYTAFVAVDERIVVEDGVRKVVRQPLPMPEGTDRDGFFGPKSKNAHLGLGGGAGGAFGGRHGGRRVLRARGGGARKKSTLDRALDWLADHRAPGAAWDSDGFPAHGDPGKGPLSDGKGAAHRDVSATGLALLAFLGAGHTHREGRHKADVREALRWLEGRQDQDGCFADRKLPSHRFEQAIGALAMAEAYGLTKSAIWKASAQRALRFIEGLQGPDGGWRHPGAEEADARLSVLMVMALKSGRLGGLDVDDGVLDRARGAFREPLDAAGILGRVLCGEDPEKSPAIQSAARALVKRAPVHEPDRIDLWSWYLGTLAAYQVGGDVWKSWSDALKEAVVGHFRKRGNYEGSWDPAGPDGAEGGRLAATALMTLCTEVYHRYGRVAGTR